jgi:ABC-type transporter Mla subunit MlaD
MTNEEIERAMQFILEQQAQLTATVGRLSETVDAVTNTVGKLSEKVDAIATKLDRTADGINSLLAIAEIHDREITATNEKLNALIDTVEKYVSEGRNEK